MVSWPRLPLALFWFLGALGGPLAATFPPDAARRLSSLPTALQPFVEHGEISGAVTLVATPDEVLHLGAVGEADLRTDRPMRPDALFWIASMTKPMTAAAVMMLQDAGALSVEDPVEKYLPEFKGQWRIETDSGTSRTLVHPSRPVTLRDLLTHTSGLGDVPAPRPDASLAELVMGYAREPLRFEPGSRWSYSNAGINTLGRIVEVVSGVPYAGFLAQRLFRPLGMKDTTFWPTKSQAKRLATSYTPGAVDGELNETPIYFIQGDLSDPHRTAFPAGGLFSSARDVARFYQMMLHRGRSGDTRLLTEAAVAQMTRPQTGDLKTGFVEGMSFGFGLGVVKTPAGVTAMLSPGSFGHGGAYGTQSWADPQRDLIFVLMIQRARLPNADNSDMRRVFQQTAVDALVQ